MLVLAHWPLNFTCGKTSGAKEQKPSCGVEEDDVASSSAWIKAHPVFLGGVEKHLPKSMGSLWIACRRRQAEPLAKAATPSMTLPLFDVQAGSSKKFQESRAFQDPRVNRTPQRFPLVEVGTAGGVLWSDHVRNRHPPSGARDASQFFDNSEGVRQISKRVGAGSEVEEPAWKGQVFYVADGENQRMGRMGSHPSSRLDHAWTQV